MLSGAVVYPVGAALAVFVVVVRNDWPRTLLALVAVAHLTILVSVAFFPIPIDPDHVTGLRGTILRAAEDSTPNLVPFASIGPVLAGDGARGTTRLLVLNLFVLFPAGIYLPLLMPPLRRPLAFVPLVVVGGASIELVQAAVSAVIGHRYRWLDIDDAILNGIGLALGWLVVLWAIRFRARGREGRT